MITILDQSTGNSIGFKVSGERAGWSTSANSSSRD